MTRRTRRTMIKSSARLLFSSCQPSFQAGTTELPDTQQGQQAAQDKNTSLDHEFIVTFRRI